MRNYNENYNDRPRLIDKINIDTSKPVELVVKSVKKTGIRCLHLPTQLPVTFRKVRDEIEGEIITVLPSKIWQFKNTVYLAGSVTDKRIDINALNITPLKIEKQGPFKPDENDLIDDNCVFNKYYIPILAYGNRQEFEMEQVIPFEDPEDLDYDPILEAVEANDSGDIESAYKILQDMLEQDIRCVDAHAHLGNWEFESVRYESSSRINKAKRHYEIGIKIAEHSLSTTFHDLLPWGYINNRPYLRCLHGYGLCLWRLGEMDAAKNVFEKILWLNPLDNQGIRFLLTDIDRGKNWQELEKENHT
ncbi:MAG: cytoplasmic protein [Chitinispirillia bacterium]|jgi:tetratricopeptide (TPR) repeat protein